MDDQTIRLISDLRCAHLPLHLRGLTPMVKVTDAGARILEKYDGMAVEYISNPLVYSRAFRKLGKVEHKVLLRLFLGGHFKVYRVPGECPGEKTPGIKADYYYRLVKKD